MGAVASCLNSIIRVIVDGLTAIFNAIASVLITIVRGIGTILMATFDCIADVLCCRCNGRSRVKTRRGFRSRRTTKI
ncbi:hypothetical protein OC834_000867 [Tilletia horrida]|uniref:Uncharacterized protein n=1 Tax=Tilletia horrida TaxID=155126 RepID=A0AAN6JN32_9BASI|nr:hypothetical protein OC834_000867 [Tilletia horrida]KAK0539657.1 hypothetical protein OC835_001056 [Tilletia horrida]KAK0540439.1 hypothetical protein OC842_000468 [Tilletia horrida]KAK0556271.1 hypothetical protein OC844_005890 [Tilletia horrida]